MYYVSTRGKAEPMTLSRAILSGIAPDGGLYFPETIPVIPRQEIAEMANLNFSQSAAKIFKMYNSAFSDGDILSASRDSYSKSVFSDQKIASVRELDSNTYLLELFHGPTGAFKDFALQFLPHLMRSAISQGDHQERCILVATSGDTGGAALSGFSHVAGTSCIVFFPKQGVSVLQAAQMQSAVGENVSAVAIDQDFDAAQAGVKKIFADPVFTDELQTRFGVKLSSANSINIGRLLPQLFYVFYGYAEMLKSGFLRTGEELDVCVPTGNFGNIFSAYLAKQMGLPIGKLIVASNNNNTSSQLLMTGRFDVRGRKTQKTLSPAMDILRASNLERLLYHASGCDAEQVVSFQHQLLESGYFDTGSLLLKTLQATFEGCSISDSETSEQIRETAQQFNYVVDPHTAVGLRALQKRNASGRKCLVFSTAHYGKFGRTVFEALFPDQSPPAHEKEVLTAISAQYRIPHLPDSLRGVLNATPMHNRTCDGSHDSMKREITEFLQAKQR